MISFGRQDAESRPERINKSSCSAIKGSALSNAFLSESNNLTVQPARENTIAQLDPMRPLPMIATERVSDCDVNAILSSLQSSIM